MTSVGDREEIRLTGVDVHGHGVPASFVDDIRNSGLGGVEVDVTDGRYVLTFPGESPIRPVEGQMLDFEERLAWLTEETMSHQVIAPWLDVHGQQLADDDGREWVRRLNDAMADEIGRSAGRLRAHATLHLANAAAAARELERATVELGMTSCMIPTNFPGGDLSEPRYDALWEAAESLRAPVVLHPPTGGPSNCVPGMAEFAGVYGRLLDTTMATARLLLSGVLERFPDLQIVLVHGGGFIPYQTSRLDYTQVGKRFKSRPSDYVKRMYYDTVLMSPESISLLLGLVGSEHVVVGSDYPHSEGAPPLLEPISQLEVGEEVREAILWRNAKGLFWGRADVHAGHS